MRRWIGRIVLGLIAAVMLALIIYGYLPKPVPVDSARVTRGPFQTFVEEDGKTQLIERYTLSAPAAGLATRIDLDPGDAVQPGTVITRVLPAASLLDPRARRMAEMRLQAAQDTQRQAQAAVQHAQTELEHAQSELARTEQLARSGAATGQALDRARFAARSRRSELESARFATRVAAHSVEEAQAALSAFEAGPSGQGVAITSPIAGRVLRVMHASEGLVTPGAPLAEVGDPTQVEVVLDVLTVDAVRVRPGMPVELRRWGGDQALSGEVQRVEPGAFTKVSPLGVEEQRVNVIVDLTSLPAERPDLGDGFSVEARIITSSQPEALQVPASAVFRHGQGWATFVVMNGRARLREVKIGQRNPSAVQLLSGLREAEVVILHPGDAVAEGTRVRAR